MSERNGDMPIHGSWGNQGNHTSGHIDDQLAAYTGDELSELERHIVEQHLAICSSCRAALDDTQHIRALLASLAAPSVPSAASAASAPVSLADAVLAALPDAPPVDPAPPKTARPVLPFVGVSSPVSRREPRSLRGKQPSWGRRWNGATGRTFTTMRQQAPRQTERRVAQSNTEAHERQRDPRRTSGGRFRSAATLVATVALIALLVGVFTLMRHPVGKAPTTGSQPSVQFSLPANSQVSAVSMTASDDGWAVGVVNNQPNGLGGPKNALLVHFDGRAWTTSPDSANFPLGQLISVAMISANDGWASGSIQTTLDAPLQGLLLHYSGGHWRAVDIASLGFTGGGALTMNRSGEGWLVSTVGAKTDPSRTTLVLRYHDGVWSRFSSLPGLAQVSMLSATDGWAVDQINHVLLRYQNGAWTHVATIAGLTQVTMVSPSDGWLDVIDSGAHTSFVMRYDGQTWTKIALPDAAYTQIEQIVPVTASDVWVFGTASNSTDTIESAIAWHFSAGRWTLVHLNFQAHFLGASMASTASGWMTGNGGDNSAALMRYDNGAWTDTYYGK